MRDISVKVDDTDDTISAGDFNALAEEVENIIKNAVTIGLDPAGGPDTKGKNQLSEAVAAYANAGHTYADSGSANTYVLELVALNPIKEYHAWTTVSFVAAFDNSGASTVNVSGVGVKDIKQLDGTALIAGDIVAGQFITVTYKVGSPGFFYLVSLPADLVIQNSLQVNGGVVGDLGIGNLTPRTTLHVGDDVAFSGGSPVWGEALINGGDYTIASATGDQRGTLDLAMMTDGDIDRGPTLTFSLDHNKFSSPIYPFVAGGIKVAKSISDNPSGISSCYMVFYTSKLGVGVVEGLRIDEDQNVSVPNGRLNITNGVSFSATNTTIQTSVNSDAKIEVDSEYFDSGTDFDDVTNYRFTVPTGGDGRYLFSGSLNLDSVTTGSSAKLSLKVNGTTYFPIGITRSGTATFSNPSGTTILDLVATDYVEFWIETTDASYTINAGGSFSGCLLAY